jgi:hypothetical protein
MLIKNKTAAFQLLIVLGYIFISTNLLRSNNHPRLILTPEKIRSLKTSMTAMQQQQWKLTLQSADEFDREVIPAMKDATNEYRYIGDTMPVLGLAYWMTDDHRYVESAAKWISALLAVPEWKGSQNLGRSAWVVGCALLYDWLYNVLDENIKLEIKKRLLAETPILMNTAADHRALSNHLLIETSALGMIGLVMQDESEEATGFLKKADQWTNYIIDHAPLDGSWGEGVQYWQYGLGYFIRYLEACRTSGYKDYYPQYDWLKRTGFFPIYFSLPGRPTEVINFSDCGSKRYIPSFLLHVLALHYENGYYQDYGIKVETDKPHKLNWMDFITYNPSIIPREIYTLPTLKHFSDNDFVTMRSGWDKDATIIGFRCGPAPGHRNQNDPSRLENRGFGPGHGHPDINSFNIFAKGEWLAIDPGYTHFKLTENHNTIIVNGMGQAGAKEKWLDYMAFEAREPAPAILRVESNPVFDYVIGDAGNIYVDEAQLKCFRRHLLFLKPDIVIIADDLEGKIPSKFEWLLHARDSIRQVDQNHFEIIRNKALLWIQPLLPDNYRAEIQERKIDASDVKDESDVDEGILKTLNLHVESVVKTRYLVVLCALGRSANQAPVVRFKNNQLHIRHENKSWTIQYQEQVEKASDPILKVQQPVKSESLYHFVREK